MPIDIQESLQIVTIALPGVTAEEDVVALMQGIRTHLQRSTAVLAFVIDLTDNDGGTAKQRREVGEFFSAKGTRFGMCAGIAAVAKSDGQHGFLRGILAMGPMPCPYRLFDSRGEASSWARTQIRAAEKPKAD
jgi:hypothetical protein